MLQNVDSHTKKFKQQCKSYLLKSAYSEDFYVTGILQNYSVDIRILANIVMLLVNSTDSAESKT